jgi:hypothetical protein
MKILDKFKEALSLQNLDEATATKIIEQLDSEIEEMKQEQNLEAQLARDDETHAWVKKVLKARERTRKKNDARKKLRFDSTISPARQVRLRKLGKIK